MIKRTLSFIFGFSLLGLACRNDQSPGGPSPGPSPPRVVTFGICAATDAEAFASGPDWAQARCAPAPPSVPADANGFALNWRNAVKVKEDGLSYLAFCITGEWSCGLLRWNNLPTAYSAVVGLNSGGGGNGWPEAVRDGGPTDDTDWRHLQAERGMRIVGIFWHDMGITYPGSNQPAARFTRFSSAGSTFAAMSVRPRLVFEWIDRELNALGKPLALLGSSGGADAVVSALRGPLKDKIDYLAPVSYPSPFWDPLSACNPGHAPSTSMVDPETGRLGTSGAGPSPPSGAHMIGGVTATSPDNCLNGVLTPAQAQGSSTKEALDAILLSGTGYTGTLHLLVGTSTRLDSDIVNGSVWGSGNLGAHPFFAGARRVWFESRDEGHGDMLTDVTGPGFGRIYAELVAMAAKGSRPN